VKAFRMLKIPAILFGVGGALLLSPACKAQEVSPDHFTETGVEGVYQAAPSKPVVPPVKRKQVSQVRAHAAGSTTTLQLTASNTASLPTQPGAQPVAEKRKPAATEPKKP
jgi:hypothetical protein